MFHFLSKTIGLLAGPMSLLLILLLSGLFWRKKKVGKRLLTAFVLLFILLTNPFIANEFLLLWESKPIHKSTLKSSYETGIVLSGITNYSRSPYDRVHFDKGADRLFQAIALYKEGIIKKILITGGGALIIQNELREAEKLYDYCVSIGIPESDLILERNARNTRENALFSVEILDSIYSDNKNHLLITSAFHMRRAHACMSKLGYSIDYYPVDYSSHDRNFLPKYTLFPSADALKIWEILVKEWIGMISYKLAGYC